MRKQILFLVWISAVYSCNQPQSDSGNSAQNNTGNPVQDNPVIPVQKKPDTPVQVNPDRPVKNNPGDTVPDEKKVVNEQKLQAPAAIQTSFEKKFEGKLAGMDITMKITSNNGTITGNYFYKVSKTEIKITGSMDKQGYIILNEFDKAEKLSGQFTGVVVNNNRIEGIWSNPGKDKQFPFYVTESH